MARKNTHESNQQPAQVPAANVPLTLQEAEGLMQLCDAALKAHGLAVVGLAQHFAAKATAVRDQLMKLEGS